MGVACLCLQVRKRLPSPLDNAGQGWVGKEQGLASHVRHRRAGSACFLLQERPPCPAHPVDCRPSSCQYKQRSLLPGNHPFLTPLPLSPNQSRKICSDDKQSSLLKFSEPKPYINMNISEGPLYYEWPEHSPLKLQHSETQISLRDPGSTEKVIFGSSFSHIPIQSVRKSCWLYL